MHPPLCVSQVKVQMIILTILLVTASYTWTSAFVPKSLGFPSISYNHFHPHDSHRGHNRDTIKPLHSLFTNQNDAERKSAKKRMLKEKEHYENPSKTPIEKSKATSTFWFADSHRAPLRADQIVPCEHNLDLDGPLPFGSYRHLHLGGEHGANEGRYANAANTKPTCLLTAGLSFRHHEDKNDIDAELAIASAQKLIDSGLTTFQLNIPRKSAANAKQKNSGILLTGMEPTSEQVWTEKYIYRKLVSDTPPSVLSQCNLGTKLGVPHWDYDGTFGNGAMVREQVSDSLLNIFGEAGAGCTSTCLDSIQVDYRSGKASNEASPYTFDVMNVLFDMQREGLIRSIHGVNFPVEVLEQLQQCGFYFDTNQISGSLLNPNDFFDMQSFARDLEMDDTRRNMKVNMSRPLAGGLLTNKYFQFQDRYRTRNGEPTPQYMSPSEKEEYAYNLQRTWKRNYSEREGKSLNEKNIWISFEDQVMKVLYEISLKHQVEIASVALRWAMQQECIGSVSVGTSLNTRFDVDEPFHLPRNLRKAFSLHLDDEDLERLRSVSGEIPRVNAGDEYNQIDFSDQSLWL